jgi:hypothetical protein
MFDLEQSIAEWRKQMLAAGIPSPAPLEELENHLREDIGRLMKSGANPSQAFEIAAKNVGPGPALKREFKKTGEPLGARLVKLAGLACGTFALLFSLWILFINFFILETDWLTKLSGLLLLGIGISSWRYGYKFLPVVPVSPLRTLMGFVCCLGCLWWMHFFVLDIMPSLVVYSVRTGIAGGGALIAGSGALNAFLGAWIIMGVLAGIGHGLEKAARTRYLTAVS